MLRWFFIKYLMINQILFDMYNTQSKVVYKNKNYLCSCYVSRSNMMQCKHDVCVNIVLISVRLESFGLRERPYLNRQIKAIIIFPQ